MTTFVLKWFVPQLADWIKVGAYRSLVQVQEARARFEMQIRGNWTGMLETGIVAVTEREVE